jgi:hypothetical protein
MKDQCGDFLRDELVSGGAPLLRVGSADEKRMDRGFRFSLSQKQRLP